MKKISLIVVLAMTVMMFVGCGNNSEEVTSATPLNTDQSVKSQNPVATPEESSIATPTPIVERDNAINWACETIVTENGDQTLKVEYVLTEVDGNETRQFSENPLFDKAWYDMFTENGGEIYQFADYNFDGYMDIKTYNLGAYVNQYYNIRIWNEATKEFVLDDDYSGIANPEINVEKQQIFSSNYDVVHTNYALYNIEEGKPVIAAEIIVVYSDNGIGEYNQKVGNGDVTIIKEMSDIDKIWEGYSLQIHN